MLGHILTSLKYSKLPSQLGKQAFFLYPIVEIIRAGERTVSSAASLFNRNFVAARNTSQLSNKLDFPSLSRQRGILDFRGIPDNEGYKSLKADLAFLEGGTCSFAIANIAEQDLSDRAVQPSR